MVSAGAVRGSVSIKTPEIEHLDQDNHNKKDRLQKYCLSFEKSLVKGKEVVSKTISFSHELDEGCDEATKGGRRARLSKNPKFVGSIRKRPK